MKSYGRMYILEIQVKICVKRDGWMHLIQKKRADDLRSRFKWQYGQEFGKGGYAMN